MKRYQILSIAVLVLLSVELAGVRAEYDRRTPVVEAFAANKDAVVNIATKYVAEVRDQFYSYEDPFGFFLRPRARNRQLELTNLGSGFIIDPRGYIITNAHVARRAGEITVIMADESRHPAHLIAASTDSDIALIKIDVDKDLPCVKLGRSDDLLIGETVLAIGNPFGNQHTLTDGVVSAVHRDIEVEEGSSSKDLKNLIQTSAPINPGNSGGPLLNINGEVIGINTAINKAAQNIGYAIPVSRLQEVLPKMLNPDDLSRLDFGATITRPQSKGDEPRPGAQVEAVREGSAAQRAGLQTGDIITALNGKPVRTTIDLSLNLLELQDGNAVKLNVERQQGQKELISFELHQRPKPDGAALAQSLFGMEVSVLTEAMISRYDIYGNPGDLVVIGMDRSGPAHRAGLEPGDVLVAINQNTVPNMDDLGLKLEDVKNGDQVSFLIHRSERTGFGLRVIEDQVTLTARSPEAFSL